MKIVKLFNIFIVLNFGIISACNIKSITASDIVNKNEKIVFGNDEGVFEINQNNLIPIKVNISDDLKKITNSEVSSDGRKVFFSVKENDTTNVYIMNTDGSNKIKLSNISSIEPFSRWSSDNKKIIFSSHDPVLSSSSLYTVNSDGSNLTRLTNDKFNYQNPSFSPDGTKIAFLSDKDSEPLKSFVGKRYYTYVMNSDASGLKRLVTDENMHGGPDDWLSNDKILYNNGSNLFSIKPDGSELTQLTKNTMVQTGIPGSYYETARVSLDKKKIVFTSNRDGDKREIYLRKIDDGSEIRLTNNNLIDWFPKWINN